MVNDIKKKKDNDIIEHNNPILLILGGFKEKKMCFAFPLEIKGYYDEEPGLWISVSFTSYFNCRNYIILEYVF